ncbi:MAG: haloacid dehalogenase type II [Haloferacaceae archaeon]
MAEALCFDVYGSTHDQYSEPVIDALEEEAGTPTPIAEEMAEMWVQHQLRYSFEVTLMDEYDTWWNLTDAALDYVLDYYGVDATDETRATIMETYEHLEPYESWDPFDRLREAGYDLYILSDGNPEMLETLAANTGMDAYLDGIVSAHEVRAFKPAPEVYANMLNHVDREIDECRMVATHLFDAAGAANAGMKTAFVDRYNVPARRIGFEPDLAVPTYERLADELA